MSDQREYDVNGTEEHRQVDVEESDFNFRQHDIT